MRINPFSIIKTMKRQLITLLTVAFLGQLVASGLASAADSYGVGAAANISGQQVREIQTQQDPSLSATEEPNVVAPETPDKNKSVKRPDGSTQNPQFVLTKVNFKGNTVIDTRELEEIAKDTEGKEIYFSDLIDLTVKISRYYQSKGYLTSYAFVPEQQIKEGVAVIEIFESKNVKPKIAGNKWANDWYLENIVMGKKGLREGDVFNARPLQWALKETNNDTTYLRTQTKVGKLSTTEETVTTTDVQDRFPVKLDLGVDNFGRDSTGRDRFTATLGSQNLTGYGDSIYGGTVLSSRSAGAIAGYSVPVSPYGTRLGYDFSYSDASIGGATGKAYDLKGTSYSHFVSVTQPLVRTTKDDWAVRVGFDFSHFDSRNILGPTSDYDLRVLRTSLYGQHDDNSGRWYADIGADFGTHTFGASGDIPNGPKSAFIKYLAGAARVQKLPLGIIGILRSNGQYSNDYLYPAEQFQIGGAYTLRGYQPAIIMGDYGVTGSAELRFPIPGMKQLMSALNCPGLANKIKLGAFYDYGWVDSNSSSVDYPKNYLHTVGAAVYTNLTDWVTAQVGFGVPLGRKRYDEKNARLFFQIGTEFDRLIPIKEKQRVLDIL